MTKKKISKKPTFVVDLTKAETPEDVKFEFVKAKTLAGVKITNAEFKYIMQYAIDCAIDAIDNYFTAYNKQHEKVIIQNDKLFDEINKLIEKALNPKKPWYKKLFGWIKNPFKKN